jgi:hypothetical protein
MGKSTILLTAANPRIDHRNKIYLRSQFIRFPNGLISPLTTSGQPEERYKREKEKDLASADYDKRTLQALNRRMNS